MAISERERRDIFNGFESVHGQELANSIMELLPKQPADQLVTRTDMHAFGTGLRGEMAEMNAGFRGEMADLRGELRGEMADLRGELRGEMADLRGELRGEMIELRTDLRTEMIERFAIAKVETQRLVVASMAGNAIAVVTALVV